MASISHPLFSAFYYLCIIYGVLVALFFLLSDFIIFIPPKPSQFAPNQHTQIIPMPGGEKIYATYYPNPNSQYTLLISHGNAEDLATLNPLLEYFNHKGYSVFAYDYSGYGLNHGKPSETKTYQNIHAAYQYLTETLKIPPESIIVYGRSLGGGPSLELASHQKIAGLILESTFVSAYRVKTHIPLILFDKYKNLDKIDKVKAPILIIHGTHDEIIPFWHGQALFQKAQAPKTFYKVAQAGHNDLLLIAGEAYWSQLKQFINGIAHE